MSELRARTTAGVAWTAVFHVAGQMVQVGAGVVLARLLVPADFGTAGLALVIAGVLATVNQFGMFAAIVQRKELSDVHYSTALWASVVTGAVFGAVLYFAAGPVAMAFRNPGIVPVLRVYSLLLFFGGLSAVQSGLLTREFLFREQSLALFCSRVAGGGLSVVLALRGRGVMSIAWGYAVQMGLAAALLSLIAARVRRTAFRVSWPAFRELFRFGSGVMGANLLGQLAAGLDVMLVGRLMGPLSLGYYSLSAQTAAYLPRGLASILPQVTFSAMSRVQDRAASLRSAYLRLARICALVAVPVLAALAVVAPDLVPAMFGARWQQSVLPLQLLSLAGMVIVLDWTWGETLKAQGRSMQLLLMTSVSLVGLAAAVLVGSRFGIAGVALALVCFRLVFWLCYQYIMGRSIGIRMSSYLGALAGPALAALFTASAALGARLLVGRLLPGGHWPALAAAVLAGAAAYAVTAPVVARTAMLELLCLLTELPRVGRPAAALARRLQSRVRRESPARPRVAIITTVHSAGDTRIFHKQARTLARAGYDVTLLAPSATVDGVVSDDVTVVGLSLPRGRLLRMSVGAARALAATLAVRPYVCHFHDPELLPVGLVLRMLGKRVVYDVHEDYPEQILAKGYIPLRLRRTIAGTFNAVEKWAAVRFDAVVAATDTIADKFRGDGVLTVRNYPLLPDAPGHDPNPPLDLGSCPQPVRSVPFRLVHLAGTLTEERGITGMVKAMELLGPGFELVLAGRFIPEQYEAALRAMPGFGSVRHIPTLPHERIWQEYAACDAGIVCLMPVERYKVSLPVKLFEFMAAGLPVIASDFPLFREIVEGSGCGICVDPTNSEAIAAAIRRLQGDDAAARLMGERGIAAVRDRFNWRQEGAELVKLYQRIGRMEHVGRMGQMAESGRLG